MNETTEQLCKLEMLLGHLSDLLAPAKELIGGLRLQSNASVTTRGKLDNLNGFAGLIWEQLQIIEAEVKTIKVLGEGVAQ